jgi:hypothetical protein
MVKDTGLYHDSARQLKWTLYTLLEKAGRESKAGRERYGLHFFW